MARPKLKNPKISCNFSLSPENVQALRESASGNLRSTSAELDFLLRQIYGAAKDDDSSSAAQSWQNPSNATALSAKTGA